jgi:hypothetical protein
VLYLLVLGIGSVARLGARAVQMLLCGQILTAERLLCHLDVALHDGTLVFMLVH